MNREEGFHKRWELRSSEVDGDSSSDDEGSGAPTNKLVTDLVLFQHDEADDDDDPRSHNHGNEKLHIHSGIGSKTVKAEEKKLTSRKKKKVAVKDIDRKRRHSFNEKKMLKDLQIFADSLVRELAVAQANMFANMRDEMRKLVASKSVKKKVCAKVGTSQLQNHRNSSNLINGHIPAMDNHSASRIEFCKLMAAKSLSHRFAEFKQQEQCGGFSLNYRKTWGLYGESHSSVASRGVGLPVPLHQGMTSGFSRSSLSYMTDKRVCVARFPSTSPAPSEQIVPITVASGLPSCISEGELLHGLKATK